MSEIEEVKKLLSLATYPGVIDLLKRREQELEPSVVESKEEAPMDIDVQETTDEVTVTSSKVEVSKKVHLNPNVTVPTPTISAEKVIYIPIINFAWDQEGYDSATISVYVDLENVGSVKTNVSCNFTSTTFDLKIMNLNGKNYRLLNDNLEKDIDPEKSKFIVKKNKIVLKLQKIKGQYSYEHWTRLTSKKTQEKRKEVAKDPSGGIMDMMKEMYDEGDENMKKIIGEAMMKSKQGDKSSPMPDMNDL